MKSVNLDGVLAGRRDECAAELALVRRRADDLVAVLERIDAALAAKAPGEPVFSTTRRRAAVDLGGRPPMAGSIRRLFESRKRTIAVKDAVEKLAGMYPGVDPDILRNNIRTFIHNPLNCIVGHGMNRSGLMVYGLSEGRRAADRAVSEVHVHG